MKTNTTELKIAGLSFQLKSDESEEHMREVSDWVSKRIERIQKKSPDISLQKAAILVCLEFASESVKKKRNTIAYRNQLLEKASAILQELESTP